MYIKYILLSIGLFLPRALYAQDQAQIFKGSLCAGVNFSQVSNDLDTGIHQVGLRFGGNVMVSFKATVSVSLGMRYTQKGAKSVRHLQDPLLGDYLTMYNLRLNYIEMPLLLHYQVLPKLSIGIGLSYGRLLNSNEYYQGLSQKIDYNTPTHKFTKNEWSYMAEISYHIYKRWYANAAYQYSIKPIRSSTGAPIAFSNTLAQKNGLLSLCLSYTL